MVLYYFWQKKAVLFNTRFAPFFSNRNKIIFKVEKEKIKGKYEAEVWIDKRAFTYLWFLRLHTHGNCISGY